jgi:hypothetical protein
MLLKRDAQFGRGRPVAPATFIRGSDHKAHPHYYCDLAGLAARFAGFELLSLTQEEQRADPASGTGTSSPNGGERGTAVLVRRLVGPLVADQDSLGGESPFPSRERPVLAARGSRCLVITVRRELPLNRPCRR